MQRQRRGETVEILMWQRPDHSINILNVSRSEEYTPVMHIIYVYKHRIMFKSILKNSL